MQYYTDPDGRIVSRPKSVVIDGVRYTPPTDEQIAEAGFVPYVPPTPTPYVPTYEEKVVELIREKYTQDDEFALLRQRDTKPTEFAEYNAYCEECKQRAKEEV